MTKTKIEIETNCCGEEMEKSEGGFNGEDCKSFTCLKCGRFISIIDGQLDEEELAGLTGED